MFVVVKPTMSWCHKLWFWCSDSNSSVVLTQTKVCSSTQVNDPVLLQSFSAVLVLRIMHNGRLSVSPFAVCTYLCLFMNICVSVNLGRHSQSSCLEKQDASIKQSRVSLERQHRDITHTSLHLCLSFTIFHLISSFILSSCQPFFTHLWTQHIFNLVLC